MYCRTGPAIGPAGRGHMHRVQCTTTMVHGHQHALAGCCVSCDHGGTCESKLGDAQEEMEIAMSYLPTGQASIGPEGGLLAPSTQTYQREGAPGRLALQTEIYTLGASFDDTVVFEMLKNLRVVPTGELEGLLAQFEAALFASRNEQGDTKKRDAINSSRDRVLGELARRGKAQGSNILIYGGIGAALLVGWWMLTKKKGKV